MAHGMMALEIVSYEITGHVISLVFKVDLGSVRKIAYVLTQGRNTTYHQYVKEFKVFYSTKGLIFVPIKEPLSSTPKVFKPS
jgi:hypothetical protein